MVERTGIEPVSQDVKTCMLTKYTNVPHKILYKAQIYDGVIRHREFLLQLLICYRTSVAVFGGI